MATISRIGFGQVEPNHLSAQRTAQIYAQLPAKSDIKILENGQYVKYDYANNEVNYTGEGEWMMVFNEVKLYDDAWRESYKDFALESKNYVGGELYPRVFKTDIGDIYTTNCLKAAGTKGVELVMEDLAVEDKLVVNAQGFLEKSDSPAAGAMVWQVVKRYTLPDGQEAVKVQRIA